MQNQERISFDDIIATAMSLGIDVEPYLDKSEKWKELFVCMYREHQEAYGDSGDEISQGLMDELYVMTEQELSHSDEMSEYIDESDDEYQADFDNAYQNSNNFGINKNYVFKRIDEKNDSNNIPTVGINDSDFFNDIMLYNKVFNEIDRTIVTNQMPERFSFDVNNYIPSSFAVPKNNEQQRVVNQEKFNQLREKANQKLQEPRLNLPYLPLGTMNNNLENSKNRFGQFTGIKSNVQNLDQSIILGKRRERSNDFNVPEITKAMSARLAEKKGRGI